MAATDLVQQTGFEFLRYAANTRFSLYLASIDLTYDERIALLGELCAVLFGKRTKVSAALRDALELFFRHRLGLWKIGFRYVDTPRGAKRAPNPQPRKKRPRRHATT